MSPWRTAGSVAAIELSFASLMSGSKAEDSHAYGGRIFTTNAALVLVENLHTTSLLGRLLRTVVGSSSDSPSVMTICSLVIQYASLSPPCLRTRAD